jgi:PiT family inorganic phosphate transporter
MLILILFLALLFDFLNGFHDSSNIVATPIASGAMNPRSSLYLAAFAHFVAPFIFGFAVAKTIGADLLDPSALTLPVLAGALLGAIIWNLLTWYLGIPSSSSHALLGGLLGATIVAAGLSAIYPLGLLRIVIALVISPLLGLGVGFLVMRVTLQSVKGATPRVNQFFRHSQVITTLGLSLSHGTNDAQKTMGVITLALVTAGVLDEFFVPTWVVAISAGAIAIGTALGGWRLIRTLGAKIFRIRPIHAFTSQIASTTVIFGAAYLGGPVSTTQVMGSSITGVGAAERPNQVRWTVLRDMVTAWFLTIPATAILAAVAYFLLDQIT